MKSKELTAKSAGSLDPRSTLIRAARLMSEANVGSVPVVEGGRVVGVLTVGDIIARTAAAGFNPLEYTVGEAMTPVRPQYGDAECGALLRGELAALQTYRMALEAFGGSPAAGELRRLAAEHQDAIRLLRRRMIELDLDPPADAGLWGAFAEAVEGAAQLVGPAAALAALKEGEERRVRGYRSALDDERLSAESKALISDILLPKTWSRVSALETLLQAGF